MPDFPIRKTMIFVEDIHHEALLHAGRTAGLRDEAGIGRFRVVPRVGEELDRDLPVERLVGR